MKSLSDDFMLTQHKHAREHHRVECQCENCAYGGCSESTPCNDCIERGAVWLQMKIEWEAGQENLNARSPQGK